VSRALGWREDVPDPRDFSFRDRVGLPSVGGTETLSLLQYRTRRREQLDENSCVGFALARAIHVCLLAAGHAGAPEPSPAFIYFNGRAGEHAGEDVSAMPAPIDDNGSRPRVVMQAARAHGFCSEADCPYDTSKRNERPKLTSYRRAYDQQALQYYRLDSDGQDRIDDLKTALRSRYPVIFGMDVDQAFLDHRGTGAVRSIGDVLGRHMMCVLGYDGAVLVDNWWGDDWGFDDGFGRISDELWGSSRVADIYAVKAAPVYSGR